MGNGGNGDVYPGVAAERLARPTGLLMDIGGGQRTKRRRRKD